MCASKLAIFGVALLVLSIVVLIGRLIVILGLHESSSGAELSRYLFLGAMPGLISGSILVLLSISSATGPC
jgi:hypothetical protein